MDVKLTFSTNGFSLFLGALQLPVTVILTLLYLQVLHSVSKATITEHLRDLYGELPELQLESFKYDFDKVDHVRSSVGHYSKSALNQCILRQSSNDPALYSTLCSSAYPRSDINKLLSDSNGRDIIEVDCLQTELERSLLDDLFGFNSSQESQSRCVCFNLEKYLQAGDANEFVDTVITLYDPGCDNSTVTLTRGHFIGQTEVKVLSLSHAPVGAILPNALDDLLSLEFVSLVNNSLGDQDLPPGIFCNNVALRTIHIESDLFTQFPSQLFHCPRSESTYCLHQLTTVVISNTRVKSLPGGLLGCARNVTTLSLASNLIKDVFSLKSSDYELLKTLDLSRNQIVSLYPLMFSKLINLEHLDLSYNLFTHVDCTWFHETKSLRTLLLDNNKITEITGSLVSVRLTHFSLGFNILEIFPGNILNGSVSLRWLDLQANNISDLENRSLCDLVSLQSLNISSNNLPSLRVLGQAFCQNAHLLNTLFLHDNNITEISANDSSGFSALEAIVLNDNQISEIHPKAFSGLKSLRALFLENNVISDINSGQLSNLKALEFLHLGGNNISKIDSDVFKGLYRIITLGMAHNHLESVEQSTFRFLFSLNKLRLEHNLIQSIEDNAFPSKLVSLNLTDNLLTSPPCLNYANSLQVLILSLNNISVIHKTSFCNIRALVLLRLSKNSIGLLEPGAFLYASSLQYLDVISNRLELNFSVNYFQGITLPANFYFSLNKIRSIENLYLHQPLRMAKEIYVSFNPISHVPQQPEIALFHLPIAIASETLDLSGCNITSIDRDAFIHMVTVRKINLNSNKISHFPDFRFNAIPVYGTVSVELYENQIQCSCTMRWIKEKQLVRNIYRFSYCFSPVNQSAVLFSSFPQENFVCRTDYLCDKDLCSCYADDIASPPKVANCSMRNSNVLPKVLPTTAEVVHLHGNNFYNLRLRSSYPTSLFHTKKLTINSCNVAILEEDTFNQFRYLEELYLHDNNIRILPEGIFSNMAMLKVLALHNNMLVSLSDNLLTFNNILQDLQIQNNTLTVLSDETKSVIQKRFYLQTLALYDNPWICECDNMTWKSWLLDMRDKLVYANRIMCQNGTAVLATPDDDFLCQNQTIQHIRDVSAFAVTTVLAIFLPLFVFVTMATVYYHRHLLAVFIFSSFGLRFKKGKKTEERSYDAILLYDEECYGSDYSALCSLVVPIYKWLTKLNPPFKVMVPDIHILGGTVWAEEICKGIIASDRFVIFITTDFLKKEKTMFLFDIAYHTMMERRSSDLLLVIDNKETMKYLKSAEVSDPRLGAFLRTNNYLLAGERHFRKKLLFFLPGDIKRKASETSDCEMDNLS